MLQKSPPQGQSRQALSSKLIVDWSDNIIVRSEEPRESIAPVQDTADTTTPRMQHNMLRLENVFKRERRPHNQSYKLTVVRCPKITSNRVDTSDVPRADKSSSRHVHSRHKELARRALKSKTYGASPPSKQFKKCERQEPHYRNMTPSLHNNQLTQERKSNV